MSGTLLGFSNVKGCVDASHMAFACQLNGVSGNDQRRKKKCTTKNPAKELNHSLNSSYLKGFFFPLELSHYLAISEAAVSKLVLKV